MRVGLFGGSFNPAHEGHAHVAETAMHRLKLDKVMLPIDEEQVGTVIDGLRESLARLEVVGHGSLRQVLDTLSLANQGGILVAILGRATPAELDTLARLRRSFRLVVAIASEPPIPDPSPLQARLTRVDNTREGAFAQSWGTMVRSIRTEVVA